METYINELTREQTNKELLSYFKYRDIVRLIGKRGSLVIDGEMVYITTNRHYDRQMDIVSGLRIVGLGPIIYDILERKYKYINYEI